MFLLYLLSLLLAAAGSSARATEKKFRGFSTVKTIFSFGDSYTRTGFDYTGTQPSLENPFDNPSFPGPTSANGKNWIQYLTVKHNQSAILTYNFAISGATLNNSIVSSSVDVATQINNRFVPRYGGNESVWDSSISIFAFWIGINDIGNSYSSKNSTSLHERIFGDYKALVEVLYGHGARNFLFLNVPPLHRAPRTAEASNSTELVPFEKAAVLDWNSRLLKLTRDLVHQHRDVEVFHYDTYQLFNAVIDNPSSFPETSVYKSTTYCSAYTRGTPEPDTKYDECEYAANEYLWRDSLHPTFPIHDLIAREISQTLN